MFDVPSEWSLPPVKTAAEAKSKKKKTKNKRTDSENKRESIMEAPSKGKILAKEPQPSKVQKHKHTDQKFVQSKTKLSVANKASDLTGARFRYLNEKLYTMDSAAAVAHFSENPKDFERYHEGFANQVASWPANPVDIFIERLLKMAGKGKRMTVVDLGCGEGKLGWECKDVHDVHSFDLVALHPHIQVGDMCNLPTIASQSIDIVIFCLSLMNTNFVDALAEAHRILKPDGKLWIAEVASRFSEGPDSFAKGISKSFKRLSMNTDNPVFVLFDFVKSKQSLAVDSDGKKISLAPCLYKKR